MARRKNDSRRALGVDRAAANLRPEMVDRLPPEEQEIARGMFVSGYKDQIFQQIIGGKAIDPEELKRNRGITSATKGGKLGNEEGSVANIDWDAAMSAMSEGIGPEGRDRVKRAAAGKKGLQSPVRMLKTGSAESDVPDEQEPSKPRIAISMNQAHALQKFPFLIDYLGTDAGDGLAKEIHARLNANLVSRLEKNAQAIDKAAKVCKADGKNIKQFFAGDEGNKRWICAVTARGPFRGDEAVVYNRPKDEAHIVRIMEDKQEDVTQLFNVISESGSDHDEPST